MLKNSENNGTEEIGLVTPPLGWENNRTEEIGFVTPIPEARKWWEFSGA